MKQLPYILAGVVLMTLQPVLVTLSKVDGQIQYSAVSSTLSTEVIKIFISIGLLASTAAQQPPSRANLLDVLQYSVPAFVYFVNNNLVFAILSYVDATTFQLLSQLKTVFTGLLFRIFLSRSLTAFQYLAIMQLACGTATSQIPRCLDAMPKGQQSTLFGVALSVVSCILSAFGGIYSEKLLKNKPMDNINWQNIQLYTWGIIFNLVGFLIQKGGAVFTKGLFSGYNGWAWAVVVNNALNGLAISAILKYADNIARVYAHACAMLVTMVVSIPLFGQTPTPQLVIAIIMVASSTIQYNVKTDQPLPLPSADTPSHYAPVPMSAADDDNAATTPTSPGPGGSRHH